jgi:hypothetical protein
MLHNVKIPFAKGIMQTVILGLPRTGQLRSNKPEYHRLTRDLPTFNATIAVVYSLFFSPS